MPVPNFGSLASEEPGKSYDLVTSRAFARLNILTEICMPLVKVNGYFIPLKATLDEKRLILTTIIDEISFNEDTNMLTVKLNPLFEHLRQVKLQNKQVFSNDLETLAGTLETRSDSAKEALINNASDLNNIVMIGTRKTPLNTKIEPSSEDSKKQNVDGGT